MRGAIVALGLLFCLGLAACAGGNAGTPSESAGAFPPAAAQSGPPNMSYPFSAAPTSTPDAATEPAKPAPPKTRAANRAARGASAPQAPAAAAAPDHELSSEEKTMQARTDCWMGVERAKVGQDIDARMAWVDKCIAEKSKH